MIKHLLALLTLCLCTQITMAQGGKLKGIVQDTVVSSNIPKASITVINHTDSLMVGFTRTNAKGEFEVGNLKDGKYVFIISHPIYAMYSDEFEIKGNNTVNLGSVQLFSQEMLLKEVDIISSEAIKIKGDTIEYVADSFRVKENATVEDLFKKLPGIQVNKNGEIVAQGKRVEKVLVDGDEFFSDDPTVATQNLKAESVETVQVYEKKDEMSGSTDQGVQTINITLKEDAKKGYFGKVKGGIGTDKPEDISKGNTFYANELMLNKFRKKEKISGYFIHNNTGRMNLNWRETQSYGDNSNSNMSFGEDGFSFMFYQSTDDEFGSMGGYSGSGIPMAINGGVNYANKWNKDKHNINASYQFKQVENDAYSTVQSQNFLNDTTFNQNDSTRNYTLNTRHNMNLKYEVKLDSLSDLRLTIKGTQTNSDKNNDYFTETLNENGDFVNTNSRKTKTKSEVINFSSNLYYLKKFKNPERKLNITFDYQNRSTQSNSSLDSKNSLYTAGNVLLFNDTTDQQKTVDKTENIINASATFKEPISKTSLFEFRYFFNMSNQIADRFTYDKTNAGEYINQIDSLSSQYVYNFQSHRGGINYQYKKDKITWKIGTDVSAQFYDQNDRLNDTALTRNFINLFPTTVFVYSFNKMKQLRITYNGYTEQPSINQIQPLRDNTNPFYINTGNPDLNPSFVNDLQVQFHSNQIMKGRYFYMFGNFSYNLNDIVSTSYVDAFNRNISSYVNQSGTYNSWFNMNYYMELKKVDMDVNFGGQSNFSRNINFVNDIKNTTDNSSFGLNTGVTKDIGEWFTTSVDYSFDYNISSASIQQNASINYWTQQIGYDIEVIAKKKVIFNSDFNYDIRQKTANFTQNNNVFIWNASVDFKLFKNETGLLSLEVHDILNQNLGFQRNASTFSITETRYNVIKRFFMISFTYNFNSNKTKPNNDDEW